MLPLITALLPVVGKVIDSVFPDKAQADAAKLKLLELQQQGEFRELEAAASIIRAEAGSEHALTSQWRPIIMLLFGAIIANNYIVHPYLTLFYPAAPKLDIPPDMWDLLKIGLGGYVVGRSTEKAVKAWKAKPDE